MGKTTTKPAKEPQLLNRWEVEEMLGPQVAPQFTARMDKLEARFKKLTAELAEIKKEGALVDRQVRAAAKIIKGVDLSPVLAMKPYDDALRALLAKMKTTMDGDFDAKSRKYKQVPRHRVTPWDQLKAGATDEQIKSNLRNGFVDGWSPVIVGGHKIQDEKLYEDASTYNGNVVTSGKELVAAVRRVLGIPQPAATKPASAAAAAQPAKKGPAKKKPAPAKAPAAPAGKKKAAKPAVPTEDEDLEAEGSGGAVAPPAAPPPADDTKPSVTDRSDTEPAKPVQQPLGEWLRNARKALKRKGGNPFDVKEESPWTTWHAEGKRPADAAAAWAKGERGEAKGEGNGEEPPVTPPTGTLPATRIVEIRPSRPLYFTEVYDAFDLGVSEGEIAAAVDTVDFTKPRPGIHVLAAAVRLGEEGDPHAELHIVRDHSDHVGGAGLILLPLLPKHKAPKMTGADPVTGRPVIVNNQTLYIGHPDNGIRVDDKPAAGELAEPGKVYELEDLDATAPDLRAAFAGQAIKRGDPAKVPAPVSIDGYDFLNVGPAAGRGDDVVRLVQLQREDSLEPAAIDDLRENPRGPYCGRRVQSPGGVVYVVGPEDHDLLVRLPAAGAGGDEETGGEDD